MSGILIGPARHGTPLTLDEFINAHFEPGWRYELARGTLEVTEIPCLDHGRTVSRLVRLFVLYAESNPGVINYQASGSDCRLRLPGMQSDRHPDQALYLDPPPGGNRPWTAWIPHLVAEVLSEGGEHRDLVEKREEYLRVGVREYWILDPKARAFIVLRRAGDVWSDASPAADAQYRTPLLPGLVVCVDDLFGTVIEDDADSESL